VKKNTKLQSKPRSRDYRLNSYPIVFATIHLKNASVTLDMSSVESDDEFPNDFDGLDFSAVPGLQAQHPRAIELPSATAPPSSRSHSSGSASNQRTGAVVPPIVEPECASPSQHDSDGFEVDSFILAAIDEIEVRALQEQQIGAVPFIRYVLVKTS